MKIKKLYLMFLTILFLINGNAFSMPYQDSLGDTYEISPNSRIATTNFLVVEFLMALDKPPIGAADKSTYIYREGIPNKLPASMVDLGSKSQPNLELLKTLNPDFLIIEKNHSFKYIDTYKQIVPTIVVDVFGFKDGYIQNIFDEFKKFAKFLNAEKKALEIEQKYEKTLASAKEIFKNHNIKKAIYVEIIPDKSDGFYISVHGPKYNLLSELMGKAGLDVMTNPQVINQKKPSQWAFYFLTPAEFNQIDFKDTTIFLSTKKKDVKVLNKFKEDLVLKSILENHKLNPYVMTSSWAWAGPLSAINFLENMQKSVKKQILLHN